MIIRSSWPASRREKDLTLLYSCYVKQGFSSLKVEKLLRKICVFRPACHLVTVVRDVVVTDLFADLFIGDEESRVRGLHVLPQPA